MSGGSIVVPRPRVDRAPTALAPARALGRRLVNNVMAYGQALNERRAAHRLSAEAAQAREQAEADMLMQRITSTETSYSYSPVSAYDVYEAYSQRAVSQRAVSQAIESGYVGFFSGVAEYEPAARPRRSEPNLAEAWAD